MQAEKKTAPRQWKAFLKWHQQEAPNSAAGRKSVGGTSSSSYETETDQVRHCRNCSGRNLFCCKKQQCVYWPGTHSRTSREFHKIAEKEPSREIFIREPLGSILRGGFHQNLYEIFSKDFEEDFDQDLHARTLREPHKTVIRGPAREDLARSSYKNLLRGCHKSFLSSSSV